MQDPLHLKFQLFVLLFQLPVFSGKRLIQTEKVHTNDPHCQ